jgi:flagellar L-ring protein precursor FlgH
MTMSRALGCTFRLLVAAAVALAGTAKDKEKAPVLSPLDRYIQESMQRTQDPAPEASAGSIWSASSRLTDLARDVRAAQVDDIVTIYVVERASAVSKGATKSSRQSGVSASVNALGGLTKAAGPLANLAGAKSQSQLDGEAETSRQTVLTTTLATRVTQVLPNGNLVVEGAKDIQVNSERQLVTVRGVVRPSDLNSQNIVRSDRVAQLEVRINGKGVVGDAIRRPFFLYRLLLGVLPF